MISSCGITQNNKVHYSTYDYVKLQFGRGFSLSEKQKYKFLIPIYNASLKSALIFTLNLVKWIDLFDPEIYKCGVNITPDINYKCG